MQEPTEARRHSVVFLFLFLLVFIVAVQPNACAQGQEPALKGTISISGAWALYPMVVRWSEEFRLLHPAVRFDISAGGAGKGMADVLGGLVDIGMVSRGIYAEEIARGAVWFAVTKDAVFPTANAANPLLDDLMARGVTRQHLQDLWIHGTTMTWGQIVDCPDATDPITVYTRSDACGAAQTWAEYLGYDQEDLLEIAVYGDPGLAFAVANDLYAVGYNNLNFAYDPETGRPVAGIAVLPIDVNEDGAISPEEGPYASKDEAIAAVANGWYPSPPARNLNLVTLGKPEGLVKAFIEWTLGEGQAYVSEVGYIRLTESTLEEQLGKLR
jgi:phosphate transport system substrate-binding protein